MFIIDNNNNNKFRLIGPAPNGLVETLDKGVYNVILQEDSPIIDFIKTDDYKTGIKLNKGVFKKVRDFFDDFFTESKYKAREVLNMKHKVGVIFNGSPGTGKTFLAGQLAEELSEKYNGLGLIVTKYADYSGLIDAIREDNKDRLIILIIDEMEKTFRQYNTDALAFLSGSKERDNLIIIHTVNDSSQLPSFIKDRPSRIEEEFNFKFDDEDVLTTIIQNMVPKEYLENIKMDELIIKLKKYDNKSIDRIKHIIRDIIATTIDIEKTGISKRMLVENTTNKSIVTGFNIQQDPIQLSDICVNSKIKNNKFIPIEEFNWNKNVMEQLFPEVCKN